MTHAAEVERILAHAEEYLAPPQRVFDADWLTEWCKGMSGFSAGIAAISCVSYFKLDEPEAMVADLLNRLGWRVAGATARVTIIRNALSIFGVRTKQARP
jgi:hypothetical protein